MESKGVPSQRSRRYTPTVSSTPYLNYCIMSSSLINSLLLVSHTNNKYNSVKDIDEQKWLKKKFNFNNIPWETRSYRSPSVQVVALLQYRLRLI